jgi:hypothetical protein
MIFPQTLQSIGEGEVVVALCVVERILLVGMFVVMFVEMYVETFGDVYRMCYH